MQQRGIPTPVRPRMARTEEGMVYTGEIDRIGLEHLFMVMMNDWEDQNTTWDSTAIGDSASSL